MTVDSISSRVIYHGNASATVFPVPFQYSQSDSIRVVFTDASGTSSEIASGAFGISSTTSGTSITYPLSGSPIAINTRLTIFRDTDQSQIVALKFGGAFNPEVLEYDVFDRTVMMVQEIQDEVDRSVKVAVDSEMTQEELQDKIFTAADNAVGSASSAAISATSAANSAATATTEANRSKIEADRSQGEADRASEIAAGTYYKTTFVNKRASWAVTAAMASGATLTLPETYFPTRNHLMLFYNGVLCELRSASSDTEYQYTEIGTIDVLSSTVTIHFAVQVGDRFDMIAVASGIVDVDALPLIPVTAGGTGATTAAQALTNLGAVAKTGDTMTGTLYVGASGTNRASMTIGGQVAGNELYVYKPNLAEDSHYAAISFRATRQDGTTNSKRSQIISYSEKSAAAVGASDDPSLVLIGRGMLLAGSGESASSMRAVLVTGVTEVPVGLQRFWPTAGTYYDGSEHTVISSDNYLHLISNCNTIANAKGAYLNPGGHFHPHLGEGQSLGYTDARWDAYIRNLNVSGTVTGVETGGGIYYVTTSSTWTAPHTGVFHFVLVGGGGGSSSTNYFNYVSTAYRALLYGGYGSQRSVAQQMSIGDTMSFSIGAGGAKGAVAASSYGGTGGTTSMSYAKEGTLWSVAGGTGAQLTYGSSEVSNVSAGVHGLNNRAHYVWGYGDGGALQTVSGAGNAGKAGCVRITW